LHALGDRPRQAEIGFTLACEHQGKGYATEAVDCLLDYVFGKLGKHRVIAITDARNLAASRVLERVGMRREGHFIENVWFKGGWGDEYQ
jgi:RimJ/RimL family protein N-acetyltransferase